MKMKKWGDMTPHRAGCPYMGVAVYGTEAEMAKYYSGNCPGCNVLVKWEEREQLKGKAHLERKPPSAVVSETSRTN